MLGPHLGSRTLAAHEAGSAVWWPGVALGGPPQPASPQRAPMQCTCACDQQAALERERQLTLP